MGNIFNNAVLKMVGANQERAAGASSFLSFFPFKLSEAGKNVNSHSALTISAFYCAVNTVANSIALLPTSVFQKTDKKQIHLTDHPADYLLYREPNSNMTAFTFKFIMAVAVFMRGNAYALIQRSNAGHVLAYIYLDPDKVAPFLSQGKIFYKYEDQIFHAEELIHIPGFSFDGVKGKSIIEFAADNIGVSLAAQKFGGDSYNNRGLSQGVLESDHSVNNIKKEEISKAFSAALSSGQAHRAPMLDEGMKYKAITLTPEQAKFLETYTAGVADIARWFSLPLHKLHVSGEGGYNFLVQMSIEYIQTAVMPLGEKFKQEFERKTFTPSERKAGIYIFQNYKKLLQADPVARGQWYKDLTFVKAITPNEIRELEDMNPYEGGDKPLQMANLLNADQIKKQTDGI
jgi:HK97 family phage portal protein